MRVSVIGGRSVGDTTYNTARSVGQELATRGHTVVCGGKTGVMEAVCRGASETGGQTIGILPGGDPAGANEYVNIPIATGLGTARNVLVVQNGDAVVAIDGHHGTLSEIGLALAADQPVVGIKTHDIDGVEAVEDPETAVDTIEQRADTEEI